MTIKLFMKENFKINSYNNEKYQKNKSWQN